MVGVLIAVRETHSWQLCLPQDAPDLSEHLIERGQHSHLIRQPSGPERLQSRFLIHDRLLDARRLLLPQGELGAHCGRQY